MLRDRREFNETYRELAPLALASANRVLRDEAAAEDVVQDVFMQLWLKPSTFDPSRGSLTSYVSMLARSRALDRWRSKSARDHAVERSAEQSRVLVEPAQSGAEPGVRGERPLPLLNTLNELPTDQRDAVLLAYGRGLTAHEIAKVSHVPLGTAKSRVRLGLRKARATLKAAA